MIRRHTCTAGYVYVLAALVAAGAGVAAETAPTPAAIDPTTLTTPALQGLFGYLVITELARWRELAMSALQDLREGRLRVLHEHIDVDGHPVERRRPTRTRRGDQAERSADA